MQKDPRWDLGLINYLKYAMNPRNGQSGVVNFTLAFFRGMGYIGGDQLPFWWADLPLVVCGEERHATGDACIVDLSQKTDEIILLVHAIKQLEDQAQNAELVNAPAQLVAKAVAAINLNNVQREKTGRPLLS
jgi:hypothetical protein